MNLLTKDELIEDIRRVGEMCDGVPTYREYQRHANHSANSVQRLFGSWNSGLMAAGYEPNQIRGYERKELIGELKRVADKLGHSPTIREFDRHSPISADTYERIFNSWNSAKDEAGLDIIDHSEIGKRQRGGKREYYRQLKNKEECKACSEDDNCVLEFHHLNDQEKENTIYNMLGGGYSLKEMKEEVRKCIPLCSNCHMRIHTKEHPLSEEEIINE